MLAGSEDSQTSSSRPLLPEGGHKCGPLASLIPLCLPHHYGMFPLEDASQSRLPPLGVLPQQQRINNVVTVARQVDSVIDSNRPTRRPMRKCTLFIYVFVCLV